MRIESLSARAFRNLTDIAIRPEAPCVVLEGNNGAGKTNILEALYLCATGRSFRRASAQDMVQEGGSQARCEALLQRQEVRHTVTVDLRPHGNMGGVRQRLTVDDRYLRQSSQLLTWVNVVAFFPDDLHIVKGSPEERRRFFDRSVAGGQPEFVEATLSYHRALKARNTLLRASQAPDRHQLAAYNAQLVQYGTRIHEARAQALAAMDAAAQGYFGELMGRHVLGLALRSGVPPFDARPAGSDGGFAEVFAQALSQSYPRDRARGMTCIGPHRSDLAFAIDGQPARSHASQGQQRALVLALKLAELSTVATRLGTAPILLLDDVSSELDTGRTKLLFALLATLGSQVWLSTTGSVALPIMTATQTLKIAAGSIASSTLREAPNSAAQG